MTPRDAYEAALTSLRQAGVEHNVRAGMAPYALRRGSRRMRVLGELSHYKMSSGYISITRFPVDYETLRAWAAAGEYKIVADRQRKPMAAKYIGAEKISSK